MLWKVREQTVLLRPSILVYCGESHRLNDQSNGTAGDTGNRNLTFFFQLFISQMFGCTRYTRCTWEPRRDTHEETKSLCCRLECATWFLSTIWGKKRRKKAIVCFRNCSVFAQHLNQLLWTKQDLVSLPLHRFAKSLCAVMMPSFLLLRFDTEKVTNYNHKN